MLSSPPPAVQKVSFSLEGVKPEDPTPVAESFRKTVVQLNGFKEEYRVACRKRATSIADKLIEHCLIYFLSPSCPKISLTDEYESKAISLNDQFRESIGEKVQSLNFNLNNQNFSLILVPLYSSDENSSRLHWCSNGREVRDESLAKSVPNFRGKLRDQDGDGYVILAYLSGTYLDKHTTPERTSFSIPEDPIDPEEGDLGLVLGPALSEIRRSAGSTISAALKEQLEPIREEKKAQIEKFVRELHPEYRALVALEPQVLDQIPPGLGDEKLELELHKAQYHLEASLKKEGQTFLSSVRNSSVDATQLNERQEDYFKKISAVSQANLAKYVLGRKVILELFDEYIRKKEDGTFDRESVVHNLIFPQYKTSDDLDYDHHNLWLVDERLAYHSYLASEKKLSKQKPLTSDSDERTDLVIFNNPSTFIEGEDSLSSVVVIEFKRPGRDETEKERDPVQQLLGYVEEIRNGSKRDKNGHEIRVSNAVPFFCYLVCDLTPKMVSAAKLAGLTVTSDNQGYFGYNPNYGAYIEVVSYKKVSTDAKKRNRVFFEKINL